jgi:hypothetical protein
VGKRWNIVIEIYKIAFMEKLTEILEILAVWVDTDNLMSRSLARSENHRVIEHNLVHGGNHIQKARLLDCSKTAKDFLARLLLVRSLTPIKLSPQISSRIQPGVIFPEATSDSISC